ncbi:MAG: hypothetical protein JL50_08320 [Peptococcaceae bacterium BICA1-7]|nr:MAG: hypothetical protein JL50_08320 [Peptococcaceae bacterium BICA1-7]HBV97433.1 hypothetical protein [Desulfotomaculum sp.]
MEEHFKQYYLELENVPDLLKSEVNKYLRDNENSKLLAIKAVESCPYIDKSIISTRFSALFENGNLLTVLHLSLCSKEEWSDEKVYKNQMIVGDIIEFIDHSLWFSRYKENQ